MYSKITTWQPFHSWTALLSLMMSKWQLWFSFQYSLNYNHITMHKWLKGSPSNPINLHSFRFTRFHTNVKSLAATATWQHSMQKWDYQMVGLSWTHCELGYTRRTWRNSMWSWDNSQLSNSYSTVVTAVLHAAFFCWAQLSCIASNMGFICCSW